MESFKYLFENRSFIGRLSRWLILWAKFDLTYVPSKIIKGRAIAKFCTHHPIEGKDLNDDFPNEDILVVDIEEFWKMYFDGSSNQHGYRVGILLLAPDGSHIPLSIKLRFIATNNVIEYKACILGMEALLTIGVKKEGVYGDLAPIISQAQRVWKTKEEHLKPYQANVDRLTS